MAREKKFSGKCEFFGMKISNFASNRHESVSRGEKKILLPGDSGGRITLPVINRRDD